MTRWARFPQNNSSRTLKNTTKTYQKKMQGKNAEPNCSPSPMTIQRFALHLVVALVVCLFPLLAADSKQQPRAAPPAPESLPTGMNITPTAARGSTFQPLNPDLPDLPQFTVDHPLSTAISPDGGTLLILTSGFNRNLDAKGKGVLGQSSEYVFVYDIRRQPLKLQVLKISNAYAGLAWAPD